MKRHSYFENLNTSEIKKAERLANMLASRDDAYVSAWSSNGAINEIGFIEVSCEISFRRNDTVANFPLFIEVYMPDRRRSFAHSYKGDGSYITAKYARKLIGIYRDAIA